ncbi:sensor histidine kinase [Nonomuraea insulae]|uniref:histidine kinase n=1 Tax=Nonomuraea insulae TaxID=1616787 RepID=A0ABW1CL23_9ACTN
MKVWRNWSIRTRLTVLSAAVMALLCAGLAVFSLSHLRHQEIKQRDDRVYDGIMRTLFRYSHRLVPAVIEDEGLAALQVIRSTGEVVAASRQVQGRARLASFTPAPRAGGVDRVRCDVPGFAGSCMIVSAVWMPAAVGGDLLVYGASPVPAWYVSPSTLLLVSATAGLIVAVVGFGTFRVVGRALRPVEVIRSTLAEITATDPGRRVALPPAHDEIQRLTVTVNETLERLQVALERERQFTSDASHDLRHPIAAMRLQMEEAKMHAEADWSHTCDAVLAGLDRLEALVTDLLTLSRLDARCPTPSALVDLSDVVSTEVARRTSCPPIISEIEPGIVIVGEGLACARLLANLLDNAERHATSLVTVRLARRQQQAVLEVCDDGPGVPVAKREEIFQRFTRLADARAKDAGGTGLGLAIARQIAERHQGSLIITDSDQGARFVAAFPLA